MVALKSLNTIFSFRRPRVLPDTENKGKEPSVLLVPIATCHQKNANKKSVHALPKPSDTSAAFVTKDLKSHTI